MLFDFRAGAAFFAGILTVAAFSDSGVQSLRAQNATGSILGTITDASGAALAAGEIRR